MWLGGCWALCIHLHTLNVAFFPTCQVRVVRFYFGLLRRLLLLLLFLLLRLLRRRAVSPLPDLNRDSLGSVFPAGPQPRLSALSVPCRTSTATPWFSVPCRTSTATICAQCSLPDLNREIECQKECQKKCQKECQKIC